MNVHLLYPDRDLPPELPNAREPETIALFQDLTLDPVIQAMSGGSDQLGRIVAAVFASYRVSDPDHVRYRQEVFQDCLDHGDLVEALDRAAAGGLDGVRNLGAIRLFARSPSALLSTGLDVLGVLLEALAALRREAQSGLAQFSSRALRELCTRVVTVFHDDFFAHANRLRQELTFPNGILISARLGPNNEGRDYMLRRTPVAVPSWIARLFGQQRGALSFTVPGQDESGVNALAGIRHRAVRAAAITLTEANESLMRFLSELRTELAFYQAGVRLYKALRDHGLATALPDPLPPTSRAHHAVGLYDLALALAAPATIVPNTLRTTNRQILVVTGANRGGKTTFLRALGQAHLFMQAGLFVPAQSFQAPVFDKIFTHFRREEDRSLRQGKLEEELTRLSRIADQLTPQSLLLMNESFAATNEREGATIAQEVLRALADRGVSVAFVTHLYEFARAWYEEGRTDTEFLRAERLGDGRRTFRIVPGPPEASGFGLDVYRRVFAGEKVTVSSSAGSAEGL
jgi:hypothetical protein